MARLTLSLLGGFQARLDLDPPLPLPAKAHALLAYLAIRPGQTHPRDKLAALLWGSTDDEHARGNLRRALFDIRQAVRGVSPEPLVIDGKTVALSAARCSGDSRQASWSPVLIEHAVGTKPGFELDRWYARRCMRRSPQRGRLRRRAAADDDLQTAERR